VVIDLTADLAVVRLWQEINSTIFTSSNYGGTVDTYYKDCINILNNIFISYTYDD
jgi:hypothetical protein